VFSVGCLLYMFVPWYTASIAILLGLIACALVTLAPLSRRKAMEAVAQSAQTDDPDEQVARFDGLDAASTGSIPLQHPSRPELRSPE